MNKQKHRVAIYARVSTDDKGQDPENQLRQLRAWCESAGYPIIGEYVEHESGTKGVDGRDAFRRLFEDAARRTFDLVLFWSLDRFSREGVRKTIMHLERLQAADVAFHSYTQEFLSTDNELIREIMLSMIAAFAKLERDENSRRTKAGLERARAKGKKLGNAFLPADKVAKIEALHAEGKSIKAISREAGVAYGTAHKYVQKLKV